MLLSYCILTFENFGTDLVLPERPRRRRRRRRVRTEEED